MLFRRAKKSAPNQSVRRFRPVVESLESRALLAGNVTASFSGGTAVLTGDGLANEIRIVGNGAGNFTLSGVGTTINGSANDFTRTGVRNILINLNNGNDTVTFVTANLPGLLSVNGGNGNDSLLFGEFNNESQIFGSVTAIMGAGNDIVRTNFEDNFTIRGAFLAIQGEGDNTTDFDPQVSLTLGSVNVSSGGGNDFVDLGDTVVNSGNIFVNSGHGNNLFFFDGDVQVNGGITVLGGNGADEFNPGDTGIDVFNVTGSIVANLGNGNNFVDFEQADTSVGGIVSILTGSGADTVDIDSVEFDALSVSLNLGAGNNTVTFDDGDVILGSLIVNTAAGIDTLTFANLAIAFATTINTGNGNDTINVDNSSFGGPVVVNTASGNDTINIETGTDDGLGTTFNSVVSVILGAGNDTVNLSFDADDFVTFNSFVTANGGAGTDDINFTGDEIFAFNPTLISFP